MTVPASGVRRRTIGSLDRRRALLALVLTLGPLSAGAQTSTLREAAPLRETAMAPYAQGLDAVKQQDWAGALTSFLAAQAADPEAPAILFNLGLVSEKLPGHDLRAIAWFQAYLLAAPAAADAAAVRTEIAKLEGTFEAGNRAILEQLDSFVALAKRNIAQLAPAGGQKWADAATSILQTAAEFAAGSHYFAADDAGASRILHVAATKLFRNGRLVVPSPSSSSLAAAVVSAGLDVDAIANGVKSGEFTDSEIAPLDYLLETGDLAHAWTFLKGRKPNDDMWIVGVERFLCTAHGQPDRARFDQAAAEIDKALAGLADDRGYTDLVDLYFRLGEDAHAEALAKAVPGGLEQRTSQRYGTAAADGLTAKALVASYHAHPSSVRACSNALWIVTAADAPNSQKLQWGRGGWSPVATVTLWWSTGRMDFLTAVGRGGPEYLMDPGWDETRLGAYVKKVGDEILAMPYAIAVQTEELTRVEFLISDTYRKVRGPVRR
jgi:hypothetical protein